MVLMLVVWWCFWFVGRVLDESSPCCLERRDDSSDISFPAVSPRPGELVTHIHQMMIRVPYHEMPN